MPDGAVLLADRYAPRGADRPPLLLVRSPYGRRRSWGLLFGRPFAERGFQAVIQSCRGTFGSGGTLDAVAVGDRGQPGVGLVRDDSDAARVTLAFAGGEPVIAPPAGEGPERLSSAPGVP
jgi:hypothetical protein